MFIIRNKTKFRRVTNFGKFWLFTQKKKWCNQFFLGKFSCQERRKLRRNFWVSNTLPEEKHCLRKIFIEKICYTFFSLKKLFLCQEISGKRSASRVQNFCQFSNVVLDFSKNIFVFVFIILFYYCIYFKW